MASVLARARVRIKLKQQFIHALHIVGWIFELRTVGKQRMIQHYFRERDETFAIRFCGKSLQ
jgi:hypothetical protein